MIKELKREHVTVWGSFRPSVSKYCYKHFQTEIPLFFSLYRFLVCKGLWHLGLLGMMGFRESCLIAPNWDFCTNPRFIAALKARGISVIVFGGDGSGAINSPELWQSVREKGATGICTDKPTTLSAWLRSHPLDS
ncbi:Lysophospholipase D gdpd1 [Kappamyces sp. JEL0680]|nr:Lysophospholipase D gdpd1 [Kappamyces sp. JEL0680]